MRRITTNLLLCVMIFMGVIAPLILSVPTVQAQGTPTPTPTGGTGTGTSVAKKRSAADTAQLMSDYWEATKDCSVPSLECLVYHTVNFVGIELVVSSIFGGVEGNPLTGAVDQLNNSNGQPINDASSPTTPVNPAVPMPEGNYPRTRNGGAIAGLNKVMVSMYANPAASTHTYVADMMNNAGIATPAYAQGLGFAALNPILGLWKIFRNLAYTFFIIMFIVIGFMIMLRTKIGSNTAVTVQQAIPQIITSLIFVTFSYAIAGFMIDMMYVLMALIIGLFNDTLQVAGNGQVGNFLGYNIFQLAGVLLTAGWQFDSTQVISDVFASMNYDNLLTGIVSGVGGLVVSVVIAIAIVIGWFKLFFELLKSYATVILSIVTSPIVLMLGAIPGRNAFGPWLKDLIGNLLPFPTVVMVLTMFFVFTQGAVNMDSGGFMPPFLVGSGQGKALANILGLAIILALPEIVKAVKKPLVKEGFGTMIMNEGLKSFKEGWNGNKYLPGGKGIARQAALLPVRAGAGILASNATRNMAKAMGMTEQQQRDYGRIAGAAGFIGGPKIMQGSKGLLGYGLRQAGQAVITNTVKQVQQKKASAQSTHAAEITRGVAQEGVNAYNTPAPQPGQATPDPLLPPDTGRFKP